jgi:MinD superfamily P-loop ATPase
MMYSLYDFAYTYCENCHKLGNHNIVSSKRKGKWIVMLAKCSFCDAIFEACYVIKDDL